MNKNQAWSLYWQNNNLESCIATGAIEDGAKLASIWSQFAKQLTTQSTVLDLATGNGSVPINLLTAQKKLRVTGVDFANISPTKFSQNNPLLAHVNLVPKVDIAKLPFKNTTFDVITSQFGFEYADKTLAAQEFIRVLKTLGKFLLIIHHTDSEVVKPARVKIEELMLLGEKSELFNQFECYLKDEFSLVDLEQSGKQFLAQNQGKVSKAITGQFFNNINSLIDLKEQLTPNTELLTLFTDMQVRIKAEQSRLTQLVSASLSVNEMADFCDMLKTLGTELDCQLVTLPSDGAILAWQVSGVKYEL